MSATGEPRRPRSGWEQGATLVEALVVVAVTAMVSALVFPAMSRGIAAAAFQQAVSGVQADLRIARAQALRTGDSVDLVVDAEGRGYGWDPGPQRVLVAGLTLAPSGSSLRFYPDGSSSGGALVLSQGRARIRFAIDPGTGVLRGVS